MDAVGSAIRVDTRGREVMRILPRVNEQVNEEWISDKTRFIWDGLRTQRLDRPYVRKDGRLAAATLAGSLRRDPGSRGKDNAVTRSARLPAILRPSRKCIALKQLMQSLGSENIDCAAGWCGAEPVDGRASYIFNPTIDGIEQADAVLIIGANPRFEAAVLNARIRKRWRAAGTPIGVIGEQADMRYKYEYLGAGAETLARACRQVHDFANVLKKAKNPMIIIGQGALSRADGAAVLGLAAKIAADTGAVSEDWNGFAVLHTAASRVGALDIGFVPGEGGKTRRGDAKRRSTCCSCSAPTN